MHQCVDCQAQFEITDEDRAFYQKMAVPEPKACPECRFIRRLNERNPRTLYTRTCDATGKSIISQYHAQVPFPVYEAEHWWAGGWDAMAHGQDVDLTRPFFDQMKELKAKVPHPALTVIPATMVNSEYNNCVGYLKNCYLISESDYDEDCYYSNLLKHCKDVCDVSICYECELCYECIDCIKCYQLLYSQDCSNCRTSYFLRDCESCTDCIGCINQKQKQYMIYNEQLTKQEYERRKTEMHLDTREGLERAREQADIFFSSQPRRYAVLKNNENSVGDHLYNSKNAQYCFESTDLEDCAYCAKLSLGVKSCMDYNSWGDRAELVYFSSVCGDGIYNVRFCTTSFTNLRDCTYCDSCVSSSNLFGCVGLNKKQYCILNRQYSKEEYEQLVPKIIEHMTGTGEWGEYFPKAYTAYGYNETSAQETFPMTKEEALARGYQWQDNLPTITGQQTMTTDGLPDSAASIDASLLVGQILPCAECQRNYKLIPQELAFYKQVNIPVPQKCPNCRHRDRLAKKLPIKLWERQCQCAVEGHEWHGDGSACANHFETAYSPDRSETVYCQECYNAEYVA